MKKSSTFRRVRAGGLLTACALLPIALISSAQAADLATYDTLVTSPKAFTCIAWQWQGDHKAGATEAVTVSGNPNSWTWVAHIEAFPGDQLYFMAQDGTRFTGHDGDGACSGDIVAEGTVSAPEPGGRLDVTLR